MELKEAKQVAIKLWTWLAETGDIKENWPGWEHNGGEYFCYLYCPLCQYTFERGGGKLNCALCPLYGRWGDNDKEVSYPCERSINSRYEMWRNSKEKSTRRLLAKAMINLLNTIDISPKSFKLGDHVKIIREIEKITGEGFIQCTDNTAALVAFDVVNKIWISNAYLELVK